jgi:hypothetical protein
MEGMETAKMRFPKATAYKEWRNGNFTEVGARNLKRHDDDI